MNIPETYRNKDWPRKVSKEMRSQASLIDALEVKTDFAALADYADDTAASGGGVEIGGLYRTGSLVKVRVL